MFKKIFIRFKNPEHYIFSFEHLIFIYYIKSLKLTKCKLKNVQFVAQFWHKI